MARRVLKFRLEKKLHQSLAMPKDAVILSVQNQYDMVTLWADCPSTEKMEARHFFVAGTGWVLPEEPLGFCGTVQIFDLVWHVFEVLA